MDRPSLTAWFDAYLERFAAVGRGDSESESVLDSYAVPLLVTNDEQFAALTSRDEVRAVVEAQVAGMRADDYARTDLLSSELELLNRNAALLRATFVRVRRDGSEIAKHTATYLMSESTGEIRISALCMHGS